jgi:hypothetical protein
MNFSSDGSLSGRVLRNASRFNNILENYFCKYYVPWHSSLGGCQKVARQEELSEGGVILRVASRRRWGNFGNGP